MFVVYLLTVNRFLFEQTLLFENRFPHHVLFENKFLYTIITNGNACTLKNLIDLLYCDLMCCALLQLVSVLFFQSTAAYFFNVLVFKHFWRLYG